LLLAVVSCSPVAPRTPISSTAAHIGPFLFLGSNAPQGIFGRLQPSQFFLKPAAFVIRVAGVRHGLTDPPFSGGDLAIQISDSLIHPMISFHGFSFGLLEIILRK